MGASLSHDEVACCQGVLNWWWDLKLRFKMEVDHRGKWIRGWIGAKGGLGSESAPGIVRDCVEFVKRK